MGTLFYFTKLEIKIKAQEKLLGGTAAGLGLKSCPKASALGGFGEEALATEEIIQKPE